MKQISAVVSLVFLATQAAALSVSTSRVKARGTLPGLLARQTGGSLGGTVPSQCETPCQILDTLDACLDDACVCTSTNMIDLETCLDCIYTIEPDPEAQAETQGDINEITEACDEEGLTVPSISIVPSSAPITPPATGTGTASAGTTGVFNTNSPSATFDPTGASTSPTQTPSASPFSSPSPSPSKNSSSSSSSTGSPSSSPSPLSGGGSGQLKPNSGVATTASVALLAGAIGVAVLALGL